MGRIDGGGGPRASVRITRNSYVLMNRLAGQCARRLDAELMRRCSFTSSRGCAVCDGGMTPNKGAAAGTAGFRRERPRQGRVPRSGRRSVARHRVTIAIRAADTGASPMFTSAAVLSLALGIGAHTAVFTLL